MDETGPRQNRFEDSDWIYSSNLAFNRGPPGYNIPPPYGAMPPPAYGMPRMMPYGPSFSYHQEGGKGLGIASMILGISALSLLLFGMMMVFMGGFGLILISLLCSIAGIITASLSIKKEGKRAKGFAVSGLVMSIIAASLSLLMSVFFFFMIMEEGMYYY